MKYQCPYCKRELNEELIILGTCHYCKKIIHPEHIRKTGLSQEEKNIYKKKTIKYKCPECSVFLSEESFLSGICPRCKAIIQFDMLYKKEDSQENKKTQIREYKCPYCNTNFSIKIYADYEVIHITSIECPACKQHIEIDSD